MYTQCPECSVAFRVTAEVLKMAAGQVRCGGCGVAFNALEHLSETKPAAPPLREETPDPGLPELQPDEPAELEADTPPESISAEQSAALLKTLDELAGEDIRIEDTGVEWRVIDEEPESEPEQPEPEVTELGPNEPSRVIDEMLFDDNTVLPDDFDEVVEAPAPPRVEEPVSAPPEPEKPQFDLDLSEPDEWDDLLGDLDDQPEAAALDDDVEDATALEPESPDEPDEPLEFEAFEEREEPLDVDTQFEIQAEAMGIDLSGIHESLDEEPPAELELADEPDPETEPEPETEPDTEADDLAETSIEEDLIAAAFETEAAARSLDESSVEEALDLSESFSDEPESLEAIAGEEDLHLEETSSEEVLALGEDDAEESEDQEEPLDDQEEDVELEVDLQVEDEAEIEDDVDDIAMGFDDSVEKDIETLSMSLDDDAEDSVATRDEDHVIPEMSEEEKTINMMIDQELFNIAVEDEDGFASTIVQLQPDDDIEKVAEDDASDEPRKKKDKKKKKDKSTKDSAKPKADDVSVETIIMEGDFIRGELDREEQKEEAAEQADAASSSEYAIPINREKDDYARRREMTSAPPGMGTWAGIAALVLLLGVQFIHHSREALATVPAFNSAIGPIYRMLGRPLTPEWNIGGWRFEATKGDTDETGEVLTIYSRVGNNSEEPLPYPLVHLSLTDRFEDIIGSAIMEPAEYLAENADPRKPVPPGSSFNAVISIESPSPNATGFKLNVCYRLAGGQLRCADHDFK